MKLVDGLALAYSGSDDPGPQKSALAPLVDSPSGNPLLACDAHSLFVDTGCSQPPRGEMGANGVMGRCSAVASTATMIATVRGRNVLAFAVVRWLPPAERVNLSNQQANLIEPAMTSATDIS